MDDEVKADNWTNTPRRFLFEATIGISVFVIIAFAAILLSTLVDYLEQIGIDEVIIIGLKLAEYAIFFTDLVLFCRFLWVTGKNTWRDM